MPEPRGPGATPEQPVPVERPSSWARQPIVGRVLQVADLPVTGTLLLLRLASCPGQPVSRQDLHLAVRDAPLGVGQVLERLVADGWVATEPAGQPAATAAAFRLLAPTDLPGP